MRSLGIDGVMPNHAWRHHFTSAEARHGIDARVAKAITGHSTSDVHDKTYMASLADAPSTEATPSAISSSLAAMYLLLPCPKPLRMTHPRFLGGVARPGGAVDRCAARPQRQEIGRAHV